MGWCFQEDKAPERRTLRAIAKKSERQKDMKGTCTFSLRSPRGKKTKEKEEKEFHSEMALLKATRKVHGQKKRLGKWKKGTVFPAEKLLPLQLTRGSQILRKGKKRKPGKTSPFIDPGQTPVKGLLTGGRIQQFNFFERWKGGGLCKSSNK